MLTDPINFTSYQRDLARKYSNNSYDSMRKVADSKNVDCRFLLVEIDVRLSPAYRTANGHPVIESDLRELNAFRDHVLSIIDFERVVWKIKMTARAAKKHGLTTHQFYSIGMKEFLDYRP